MEGDLQAVVPRRVVGAAVVQANQHVCGGEGGGWALLRALGRAQATGASVSTSGGWSVTLITPAPGHADLCHRLQTQRQAAEQ